MVSHSRIRNNTVRAAFIVLYNGASRGNLWDLRFWFIKIYQRSKNNISYLLKVFISNEKKNHLRNFMAVTYIFSPNIVLALVSISRMLSLDLQVRCVIFFFNVSYINILWPYGIKNLGQHWPRNSSSKRNFTSRQQTFNKISLKLLMQIFIQIPRGQWVMFRSVHGIWYLN